jgi:shikimate kinase
MGRPFVDTDDEIVKRTNGTSIREVHETLGELAFRKIETEVIQSLSSITGFIISIGGGAILSVFNQELLRNLGQLIYLEVCFESIKNRSFKLPLETLKNLYYERLPIYESIPACRINVDTSGEAGVLSELESIIYLESMNHGV